MKKCINFVLHLGTKLQLDDWEYVTCMKHLYLSSEGMHSGMRGFLVVGTNFNYGEDITSRGNIKVSRYIITSTFCLTGSSRYYWSYSFWCSHTWKNISILISNRLCNRSKALNKYWILNFVLELLFTDWPECTFCTFCT